MQTVDLVIRNWLTEPLPVCHGSGLYSTKQGNLYANEALETPEKAFLLPF